LTWIFDVDFFRVEAAAWCIRMSMCMRISQVLHHEILFAEVVPRSCDRTSGRNGRRVRAFTATQLNEDKSKSSFVGSGLKPHREKREQ